MAKRGSEDLRAGSEVLSDGIGDVESLTSDVSTSVERLCPLLDERVSTWGQNFSHNQVYHDVGGYTSYDY